MEQYQFSGRDAFEVDLSDLMVKYGVVLTDAEWELVCNILCGNSQRKRSVYNTHKSKMFGGTHNEQRTVANKGYTGRGPEPDRGDGV